MVSNKSEIEWTDVTWNPVTGCTKVSRGCKHCYAERIFARPYPGRAFTDVRAHEDRLDQPMRMSKPKRIFVNSMSDLFHEEVPDDFIDRVFAVMGHCSVRWAKCGARDCDHENCPDNTLQWRDPHTFQVLTKRAQRMLDYMSTPGRHERVLKAWGTLGWCFEAPPIQEAQWPLPNVWLGVSVEDQATADERIPLLLQTPAAVRWISAEPLLAPIDFQDRWVGHANPAVHINWLEELGWVVTGGESGPKARPSHPDWFRLLRDQCAAVGTPFFFKQWGEWVECETDCLPEPGGHHVYPSDESISLTPDRPYRVTGAHGTEFVRVGKKAAGRTLDGRIHDEYPA